MNMFLYIKVVHFYFWLLFFLSLCPDEMKSFTQQTSTDHFIFTWTIVLLALFCSLVIGEALVLGVSLHVGIGVAVAIFVLQLIFYGEFEHLECD